MLQKENGRCEIYLRAADGALVPAYLAVSKLQLDYMVAFCAVITDLTEQRRAEQIIASERFARAVLEQAGDTIMVCDAHGVFVLANTEARRLLGKSIIG